MSGSSPRTWEEAEIALREWLDDDDAVTALQQLQWWGWQCPVEAELTVPQDPMPETAGREVPTLSVDPR